MAITSLSQVTRSSALPGFLSHVKLLFLCSLIALASCSSDTQEPAADTDPLPSWAEGERKQSIIDFVTAVTDENSPHFVAEAERIATFDNDGTLWSEKPVYVQLAFAVDRIKALAPQHPEWKETDPFASVLEGDLETALAGGTPTILQLVMSSHAGMTTDEFEKIALDWINTARHPQSGRLYKEMVYQPMLELLDYLRANGFKTWIVSGGGIEFMRPWAMEAYGIPPEQVIGSSIRTQFKFVDDKPSLVRMPKMNFIDDKHGKPIAINLHIGRKPIAAFGNSDGDLQMLQWATSNEGLTLGMIIRHTDAEREWAYDKDSHVGRLDRALDAAVKNGWQVVDMKQDWKQIYPAKR